MSELEQVLIGDSAAAPPAAILEGLASETAHQTVKGAPHTIFGELWHIAFWQQVTLDWVSGIETPFPSHASAGFPSETDAAQESWDELRQRFFHGIQQAAAVAREAGRLDQPVRCPSRPGSPVRIMTVREQLESLGTHNAYHFGRIVLLRQLLGAWPPPSGGYSW
ncbi:MAG TPA: DinB family protein [Terracidiphilus sp.]|nr:DinB family protein [Terracidiphilus sp.]